MAVVLFFTGNINTSTKRIEVSLRWERGRKERDICGLAAPPGGVEVSSCRFLSYLSAVRGK